MGRMGPLSRPGPTRYRLTWREYMAEPHTAPHSEMLVQIEGANASSRRKQDLVAQRTSRKRALNSTAHSEASS